MDAQTQATREAIVRLLGDRASSLFVREPLIDARYPMTSDADVIAFAGVDSLLPERLNLPSADGSLPIDVIWLPDNMLHDPAVFAGQGVLPHRLVTSTLLLDRDGSAARRQQAVCDAMWTPSIHARRIRGFMEMGFLTVQEIGVTWDCPAVALFWLHIAFAASITACADALGVLSPNVYTRPFDYADSLPDEGLGDWIERLAHVLQLDVEPTSLIAPLRELHEVVASGFPEPAWPSEMRGTTRAEYRYFRERAELEWRIGVAREMIARGDHRAATYYLRFWAYSLARIPMVWQCAQENRDVSFVRPERAVSPALRKLCPPALELLATILAKPATDTDDVTGALAVIKGFREHVISIVNNRNIPLGEIKPWAPYQRLRSQATPV
jgi:hypothetical protein